MKRFVTYVIVLALTLLSTNAFAGKIDPHWRVMKAMQEEALGTGKSLASSAFQVSVFIKSTDTNMTTERIVDGGGKVGSIIGQIMTATLPEALLDSVEHWSEVIYVEVGKPVKAQNDLADADTGVTSVHAGTDLPEGYDGTGVIVGIIDSGIDLNHPAFFDDANESRVLYAWDQNDNTGPGPSEIISTYGTEYKHAAIMAGTTNFGDTNGHGTHVSGTAAGVDATYPGVAPKSDIIVVGVGNFMFEIFTTAVCDAAYYIFEKATYLGRPAVINISLGSNYGAHDGTSLFEECIDNLVAASSGRVVVAAAGNSNGLGPQYGISDVGAHVGYSVSSGVLTGSIFAASSYSLYYLIDLWENSDCNTDVQIAIWDLSPAPINWSPLVSPGEEYTGTWGAMAYGINRTETSNLANGKRHSSIFIIPDLAFDPSSYFFDIVFSGTCSHLDAWVDPDKKVIFGPWEGDVGGILYHHGDSVSTVNMPASASNAIAVGAYATRTSWTDAGGIPESDPLISTLGDLAYFSSRGPALSTAQGYKPNIAAPGAYTISALSSAANPQSMYVIDDLHQIMPGTSMASPHVAGIVALMLQVYPSLTYSEVMSYLQSTARTDSFVGSVPNPDWGYGKVDALAAVNAVLGAYPPGSDWGDYSGITITGITDGATDVPSSTQSLTINFPRAALESTCTTTNLYVTPASGGSSSSVSMGKAAWDETICDASTALAASTIMASATALTLDLNSPLGEGSFALCVTPDVRCAEEIKFGGKAVTFATSAAGGGAGGGCQLMPRHETKMLSFGLLVITVGMLLAMLKKRKVY